METLIKQGETKNPHKNEGTKTLIKMRVNSNPHKNEGLKKTMEPMALAQEAFIINLLEYL